MCKRVVWRYDWMERKEEVELEKAKEKIEEESLVKRRLWVGRLF